MSRIIIKVVRNGFIVSPLCRERHSEADDEETTVFETHKALFDYIEKTYPTQIDAMKRIEDI